MSKEKEYRIETLNDIVDCVNTQNIDNFMVDLRAVIDNYMRMMAIAKTVNEDAFEGKRNSEIMALAFTWIDDGKHDHRATTLTGPTGSVTIQHNKP